ncbi:MAG: tRNA pseudouridine(38-40) synthase TruA, partial [Pseudomonadota bacterium]
YRRDTTCSVTRRPVKTMDEVRVERADLSYGSEIRLHLRARSFLHNQVRSLMGTLERVGAGAWAPDDVRTVLDAADRSACGPVAPPEGLYLTHVGYPTDPFAETIPQG